MLTASSWSAIAERAFGLQLAIEAAGDLEQRCRVDGLPLWPLVRDALFERAGGILDQVVAEVSPPPRQAPASSPRRGRMASFSAVAEHGFRTLAGHFRQSRGGILVLAQQGLAARGLPVPWDRWTLPFREAIGAFSPATFVSLRPPGVGDLSLIASGRYIPWQAGLELRDLVASRRLAGRLRRALAVAWADPAVQAITALPDRGGLESVFLGLARDVSLGWLLCRAADRLIEGLEPDVVLSFDALGNAGRAFAGAGARLGVPVVGVQGGVISPTGLSNLGYRLDLATPDAPRPDKVFVWGPFYAALLESFGWPAGSVAISGLPGGRPDGGGGTSVLYLASANSSVCRALAGEEDEVKIVQALADAVGGDLVVRLHPGQVGSRHEAHLRSIVNAAGGIVDPRDRPLSQALARAAMVLGGASTATVEAIRARLRTAVVGVSGIELTGLSRLGLPSLTQVADVPRVLAQLRELSEALVASVADQVAAPSTASLLEQLRPVPVVG